MSNKMKFNYRRDDSMVSFFNSALYDLPAPVKMKYMWKFGSLLGVFLFMQIMSGVFLSMFYISSVTDSFSSMNSLNREINKGWIIRLLHVSGASCFFLFIYFHIGRGLYYKSYKKMKTWLSGVTMLILSMAAAFLGYVLPWGQMSYWGATVMTKFLSVMPYVGQSIVIWLWGSFSVDKPTLKRFFALHFLVPFIMLVMVFFHIMFLHEKGSNKPLGVDSNKHKILFFPYYLNKDMFGFLLGFIMYLMFFLSPENYEENQKFIQAKALVTPNHIQPEWYFLAAYAVLRSVPSKLGGVLLLVFFIMVLYFLPFLTKKNYRSKSLSLLTQFMFWVWVTKFLMLTWVGSCVVEEPYVLMSRLGGVLYFGFYSLDLWKIKSI